MIAPIALQAFELKDQGIIVKVENNQLAITGDDGNDVKINCIYTKYPYLPIPDPTPGPTPEPTPSPIPTPTPKLLEIVILFPHTDSLLVIHIIFKQKYYQKKQHN